MLAFLEDISGAGILCIVSIVYPCEVIIALRSSCDTDNLPQYPEITWQFRLLLINQTKRVVLESVLSDVRFRTKT